MPTDLHIGMAQSTCCMARWRSQWYVVLMRTVTLTHIGPVAAIAAGSRVMSTHHGHGLLLCIGLMSRQLGHGLLLCNGPYLGHCSPDSCVLQSRPPAARLMHHQMLQHPPGGIIRLQKAFLCDIPFSIVLAAILSSLCNSPASTAAAMLGQVLPPVAALRQECSLSMLLAG
jgi:hypothetical protein